MEPAVPASLIGSEIHGFKTLEDLDVRNMFEEAKTRWLRPNEIHAILCNHMYFTIHVKPMNLPKSGTIVLFDRKMLRNFRKDGHNWKKKKDGKTVKEAHEHLKVGNDERIHVYYAHGEDRSTFVRRCYWLLDKKLEHIVLVHYRDTQELQSSPVTPVDSNSSSDPPTSWNLSEENDSGVDQVYHTGEPNETIKNHQMRLHEINTLEWEELVVPDDSNRQSTPGGGNILCINQQDQYQLNGFENNILEAGGISLQHDSTLSHEVAAENPAATFLLETPGEGNQIDLSAPNNNYLQKTGGWKPVNLHMKDSEFVNVGSCNPVDLMGKDELRNQDSFGRWMNYIMTDPPGAIDDPILTPESLVSSSEESFRAPGTNHGRPPPPEQIFSITDISPAWALSTEETKIIVVGVFHKEYLHLANSNLSCVCGDVCVPAEVVQPGVFRCFVSKHSPGVVNLFMSCDGHKPISQVVAFEYRAPPHNLPLSSEEKSDWEEFRVKMRLAHLLYSTSKSLNILSGKVPQKTLKEAKMFAQRTRHIVDSWDFLINAITEKRISFPQAKNSLFELTLQNRLHEWLLESIIEGCKMPDRDDEGQGVIHLCAILDYTWAIFPYSWSGLSLDFRDKFGWTALHWAAYYGRQRMVAALLSAGANPNLVTDPNLENPAGCTPADLASKSGYEGLAGYLAEKALVAHFEAMTLAGNVSGSLQSTIPTTEDSRIGISEEEQYLKETLAAYRTAADAAARIQAAFREQSFKLRKKAVEFANAEDEARCIIAAMRIQHAFRNHETRKQMAAAARIQYRFRTWKIRKDFLNMRRQAIKIQAIFRGYQVRKQYQKIVWSVGVLEKVILRWRLKRKGFRGLQVAQENNDTKQENNGEEDFFHASRKQAEERVERSVVRVQAMFRSKKAQEEYRKIKLAYNQASLEFEGLRNPPTDME